MGLRVVRMHPEININKLTNQKSGGGKRLQIHSIVTPVQKPMKVLPIATAQTYGAQQQILELLTSYGIKTTDYLQESDVILLFCPILPQTVSYSATNRAAVRKTPGEGKPVVSVLMRQRFDPADKVLDTSCCSTQHPCLKEEVRVLFHQTSGLLKCHSNQEAMQTLKTLCDKYATPAPVQKPMKVLPIATAQTYGAQQQILEQLTADGIKTTDNLQESDVILLFCPILPQTMSGLDAAVRKTPDHTRPGEGKPVVSVLMHQTFDPTDKVLDTTCCSTQHPCLKEEVRVLFHQTSGLLKCRSNQEAMQTLKTLCDKYATPGGAEGKPGVLVRTHSNLDEVQNINFVREKHPCLNQEVHEKNNATSASEEVKPVNMFTIIMGETSQAFQKLLEKLSSHSPRITKSEDIDGCDAILVISSFQSWHSAYMKTALETIPAPDKPVVLVLVHKPGSFQPGTRLCAEFPTLKEEVHIEYNYTKNQLQECDMNQKAIEDLKKLCDHFCSTGWEMMQMEI
uniref:Uncharacterized protein n=1 Tax=Knipowitschia caucasica TaxID=637954 RepID=A0AAV2J4U4_KNICA